ncbi:MAG: hypothetical protein IPK13_09695 [Deltaproteobacteria bacterium]|nr:hypothetical protein [Deltaproteobacteria bacterium]
MQKLTSILAFVTFVTPVASVVPVAAVATVAAASGLGCAVAGRSAKNSLELVESWPRGTTLDHPDLRDTADVWVEMIDRAKSRIDFLEFYAVSSDDSAMTRVLDALDRARARGVRIRVLVDARFSAKMPDLPARWAQTSSITVRRYDLRAITGGVQHAKLFLVDDEEAFVGSQNFDWRALEHIQELGLRISEPDVVRSVRAIFELDWALAGGEMQLEVPRTPGVPSALRAASSDKAATTPITTTPIATTSAQHTPARFEGEPVELRLVASPEQLRPPAVGWTLDVLREALLRAHDEVCLQMLDFHVVNFDGQRWLELDAAIRAAAKRGVRVKMLLSDWSLKRENLDDLRALATTPNVELRVMSIPEDARGFIPYARTVHAKYMSVDGHWAWIGSSNGAKDYFYASRNVGIAVEGPAFAKRLAAFFEGNWTSAYAKPWPQRAR